MFITIASKWRAIPSNPKNPPLNKKLQPNSHVLVPWNAVPWLSADPASKVGWN